MIGMHKEFSRMNNLNCIGKQFVQKLTKRKKFIPICMQIAGRENRLKIHHQLISITLQTNLNKNRLNIIILLVCGMCLIRTKRFNLWIAFVWPTDFVYAVTICKPENKPRENKQICDRIESIHNNKTEFS